MEEDTYGSAEVRHCYSRNMMSPEIIELGEDSMSFVRSRDGGGTSDVYVAVGKDDLNVLKWAIDHVVSPGTRVYLVHVFPPITFIPTPVGKVSRSQMSQEQVRVYINQENNRRKNLLQKYICLCTDAKVAVDTMLLESNVTKQAILELIPVLNITNLVIGNKRQQHYSRWLRKKLGTGEYVKKNAPEYCEVSIVYDGKKVLDSQRVTEPVHSPVGSGTKRREITRYSEKNYLDCVCFSGKFS